jgi:hypothetical protein
MRTKKTAPARDSGAVSVEGQVLHPPTLSLCRVFIIQRKRPRNFLRRGTIPTPTGQFPPSEAPQPRNGNPAGAGVRFGLFGWSGIVDPASAHVKHSYGCANEKSPGSTAGAIKRVRTRLALILYRHSGRLTLNEASRRMLPGCSKIRETAGGTIAAYRADVRIKSTRHGDCLSYAGGEGYHHE